MHMHIRMYTHTHTHTHTQSATVEPPVQAPPEPEAKKEEEEEEEEEEEGGDTFEMDISIADPEKVGEGMGAYIAYNVTTKTSMPSFKSPETTVKRRFSDFLGLHSRLSERYLVKGRIVPPAPEKSVVGMTKVKFSKTEDATFIERRRAALERLESALLYGVYYYCAMRYMYSVYNDNYIILYVISMRALVQCTLVYRARPSSLLVCSLRAWHTSKEEGLAR